MLLLCIDMCVSKLPTHYFVEKIFSHISLTKELLLFDTDRRLLQLLSISTLNHVFNFKQHVFTLDDLNYQLSLSQAGSCGLFSISVPTSIAFELVMEEQLLDRATRKGEI